MKKLISVLLLLAMMLTVFAACGNSSDNGDTTIASNETTTTEEDDTTSLILPARDFQGYTFRWLTAQRDLGIVVDEGEVVDDTSIAYQAQVERDSEIIDKFNISFQDLKSDADVEITSYVVKDAMNPESSFDVGNIIGPENAAELVTSDLILDARDVPYLNLDQAWYQQQANEEYYFLDKQYFIAGAFPSLPTASPLLFNINMIEDLKLELPYDTIIAGDWTIEEMMKYTTVGYSDTNGAVPGPDGEDVFGYSGMGYSIVYFYQGMGGQTTTRNDAGELVPLLSNNTVDAIFSKVREFYDDPNNYVVSSTPEESHRAFYEGRGMFCYWITGALDPNTIDSFDRGLAILPKYDLDQESYRCPTVGGIKLFPANIADIEPTGYIYEALCESTQRIVYPATIQEAIDFEELVDEGSIEVQKIVDQSLLFDVLKNCDPSGGNLGSCAFFWYCIQNNTTPATMAQAVKGPYEKMFTDFFAKVREK